MTFDPKRTALLSMDLQTGIVSVYIKDEGFIPRAAGVIEHARRAGITIIHVKVGFRPGLPEVSPHNKLFANLKASPAHQQLFQGENGAIHPLLKPAAIDLVVTKSRVSAFAGTDLELLLRANDIQTLIMFGVATSGVVLSTLLAAFDADYEIFVIKDCCADRDPEIHQILVERFFPQRAHVITAIEFQKMLQPAA